MSAYLIGRDDDYLRALDRAHRAYLDADDLPRAVRCAFWLGTRLAFRGEMGPATGWFGRAQRLLERYGRDCVEQGYLLLSLAEQHLEAANSQAAYATATSAAEIGERFGEADLIACARHLQGRSLIQEDRVDEGLALLDEAMVAAIAGELSPIMTGLIYCSVIDSLSAGICTRSRTGVDGGSGAVVLRPTAVGQLHRHLPGASRGDHATDRGVAGRRRGGASRLRRDRATAARGCVLSAGGTAAPSRVRSRRRRSPIKARARGDMNHSRAWLCCGWHRDALTTPPPQSAGLLRR